MIERAPLATGVPRHVAIIMDGNRRWARANGLPALEGHRRGMQALERTVDAALAAGVAAADRLRLQRGELEPRRRRGAGAVRPGRELRARAGRGAGGARGAGAGHRPARPAAARACVEAFAILEQRTAAGAALTLTIAVDYGARAELREACQALAREVAAGRLDPERIDEDAIAARLWTAGSPDPDLVVRTGGELRLSNFLLYQCAYAELWATADPWPEFDAAALDRAIDAFAGRERRFGR